MEPESPNAWDRITLLLAQGLAVGRVPFAPGTLGAILGFGWIYLLLLPRSLWLYGVGMVAGFAAAILIGTRAEKLLGKKDPSSVVIDEIVAMPLAFLAPVIFFSREGISPPFQDYLVSRRATLVILCFVLFRLFDIWKPFGISKIQALPGGWGLVLDDLFAALPVQAVLWIILLGSAR